MNVSIITPSYNSFDYLQRCANSVSDQSGVDLDHFVVDGGSTDGTVDWLKQQTRARWVSEPDHGMYDAINKGLDQATGDIVAYLNCDEQYLENVLRPVADFFAAHPDVDIVYADSLLVRPDGSLIAYRKTYPLRWRYVLISNLYVLSCSTFWRRNVIADGNRFDTSFKYSGDVEFMVRLLRAGYTARRLKLYTSAFTMTGDNMSALPKAREENQRLFHSAPRWVQTAAPGLNALRGAEKVLHGAYHQAWPLTYSLYPENGDQQRTPFTASHGSSRWADQ